MNYNFSFAVDSSPSIAYFPLHQRSYHPHTFFQIKGVPILQKNSKLQKPAAIAFLLGKSLSLLYQNRRNNSPFPLHNSPFPLLLFLPFPSSLSPPHLTSAPEQEVLTLMMPVSDPTGPIHWNTLRMLFEKSELLNPCKKRREERRRVEKKGTERRKYDFDENNEKRKYFTSTSFPFFSFRFFCLSLCFFLSLLSFFSLYLLPVSLFLPFLSLSLFLSEPA